MASPDDAPGFDSLLNADHVADGPEDNAKWNCFSCGKYLGEQGGGGSFTLDFGYGSSYDTTQGVCGWVCDECVTQKHGRLLVRKNEKRRDGYWANANYAKLSEHEETQSHVSTLDYFGRRQMPWGHDHDGHPYKTQGDRQYETLTSEERGRVESWLFKEDEALDRDLIVKLLQALMASEARCAHENSKRWRAEHHALDRARQQAERLSAEDLAQLRAREQADLSPTDWRRVWEHAEWNERHFRQKDEQLRQQAIEIEALRAEKDALQKRLRIT